MDNDQPARPATIITGGSRGIGAAIADRLARDGHDLFLTYRSRQDAADEVAQRARSHGARVELHRCDMAVRADVLSVVPAAVQAFGTVTGLVNNAGITGRNGPFLDLDVEEIERVLYVNTVAPTLISQQALAHMARSRGGAGGCIVNISSGSAISGAPNTYIHYAASKAGVNALTTGLAKEFGPEGVRVNTVSPGTTLTDIHGDAGRPNAPQERAPSIPMRRPGRPEEIAGTVAYLFSEDASYTSGANIRVGGGG